MAASVQGVCRHVGELIHELVRHDGFGRLEVDVRILRRRQKEVIVRCGKEYRYVLDWPATGSADRPADSPPDDAGS